MSHHNQTPRESAQAVERMLRIVNNRLEHEQRDRVTPFECIAMRALYLQGCTLRVIALTMQRKQATIIDHVHGECSHNLDDPLDVIANVDRHREAIEKLHRIARDS